MFAICALVVFLLALFGAHIAGLNLLYLGLAFLAAAHIFGAPLVPWRRDR